MLTHWFFAALSKLRKDLDDEVEDSLLPFLAVFTSAVGGNQATLEKQYTASKLYTADISRSSILSSGIPRGILLRRQISSTVIRRGNHGDTERICSGS
jgi:hypothetical protein